jgi:hypothetical protein
MPSERQQNVVSSINVLEKRICEYENQVKVGRTDDDNVVFPDRTASLFYFLLGNSYTDLHGMQSHAKSSYVKEFSARAFAAHTSSVTLAATCLDVIDC